MCRDYLELYEHIIQNLEWYGETKLKIEDIQAKDQAITQDSLMFITL